MLPNYANVQIDYSDPPKPEALSPETRSPQNSDTLNPEL